MVQETVKNARTLTAQSVQQTTLIVNNVLLTIPKTYQEPVITV